MKKIISVMAITLLFIGCSEKENQNESTLIDIKKNKPTETKPKGNSMPTWEKYQ